MDDYTLTDTETEPVRANFFITRREIEYSGGSYRIG